jgi:hypothetical protein
VDNTLTLSAESFLLELPHGVCFEKRYDRVSLKKGRAAAIPPFEVELRSPGRTFIEEIGREVAIEEAKRCLRCDLEKD